METKLEFLKRINNSNLTAKEKVEYTSQVLEASNEEVVEAFAKEQILETVEAAHTHVWIKTEIPWRCISCGALMI